MRSIFRHRAAQPCPKMPIIGREFARYGELLKLEFGVEPTERLRALWPAWAPSRPGHGGWIRVPPTPWKEA
jgi:hypothetical protein